MTRLGRGMKRGPFLLFISYLFVMRKVYITEKQKNHLKKAIAAQDQVGGKVNAGIMGAVTGMVCEKHGDTIQTWYRGYDANYPNLGVPRGGGMWLTDEYDYAKMYADNFENGKVAAVTIDFSKINWASETEIYDSNLDPYESGDLMAKAVKKLGFNAWICDYYDDNAQGLCLLDMSAVVSIKDCTEGVINEDVDDQEYQIGFEKGGFEPYGHVVKEDLVYQHGATPHKELPDFKPNLQPLTMYKQFKLRLDKNGNNLAPGYVFPLYVNTEDEGRTGKDSQGLKIGVWYRSGEGECWLDTKNNRLYTVGKGYGTDGNTLSKLAYRPGWHLTTTPWGNQRGENKAVGGLKGTGNNYMTTRSSEVWAKVEICVDIDATEKARSMSTTPADQCLQSLGDREYYKYRTNSNATDDQSWYIVSLIRIVDILDDDTVDATNDKYYADIIANNPGKRLNSDPYTYTKDLENDVPYWKMPRTNGKRYSKEELQAMGYYAAEPTVIKESPDGVLGFDVGYKDDDAIAFMYSEKEGDLVVGWNTTHPQLIRSEGGDPDDMQTYGDMQMRGRYWQNQNIISFWETPSSRKLSLVVDRINQLCGNPINKKTLIVDVWDWGGFDWEVPYKWFFDGFLDDFGDKISRILLDSEEGDNFTFRVDFKDGNVYYCGLDGVFKPSKYGMVSESRELINESHEWCDDFNYAPYFKSICDFFVKKGLKIEPYPHVKLHTKEQEGLYIKTGYYDPETNEVHLFIADRHPKDVLRSFAHELIHHSQNIAGTLGGYKGQTLDGDSILQELESEAYLKGNIYFRKWTEELHPVLPQVKGKLNESMQDILNIADDFDEYGVGKIINEFFANKRKGIARKQWSLIPAQQYQNLLTRYMQDPIMARIPNNVVYNWFMQVVRNVYDLEWMTELCGHTNGLDIDSAREAIDYEFGEGKYEINDWHDVIDLLENYGFEDWCRLPDDSPACTDYGLQPLFRELSQYKPGMSGGDLLVLLNRVLHVGHVNGDLASAFIEGGSRSCSAISGIVRENNEVTDPFKMWFGNSKVVDKNGNPLPMYHGTDANFTAFSKEYFTHGSTAYLGIGFNFTSSDGTARGYGKNVHEVYLRAINPMTNLKKTLSLSQVEDLVTSVDWKEDPDGRISTGLLGYRVDKLTTREIVKTAKIIYEYCESDADIYSQFSVCYSGSNDEKIPAAFKQFGFDSCIEYDKYSGRVSFVVVFEPNQIKSVNAQNFNLDSDEMIDEDFDMGETTEPGDVDLSSFNVKAELNQRFWEGGKLNSEIRLKLMEIADDFIDYLGVDFEPVDIIVTGSIANYNWSQEHSDVDLHIVANFDEISDNTELIKNFFDDKRKIWNDEHQGITIAGFPVELYVQDAREPHASSGVYSIEKNKWLVKPSLERLSPGDMDDEEVKKRVAMYMNEIDDLADEYEDRVADVDLDDLYNKADQLFKRIKKERKDGFTTGGGEYNNGNIVFKTLRRTGYTKKLLNLRTKAYDQTKSLFNENNNS